MKALARLEPVVLAAREPPPRIAFPEPPQLSPPLISLDRASVGYAAGKPVLSRLDLRLDPDDRIALLGANGNGKTTFARLLAGRLRTALRAGDAVAQARLRLFRPTPDRGDAAATIGLRPFVGADARRVCPKQCERGSAAFGFGEDKAFVAVGELSGGERARLNLALVTHDAPALLVLDEPTNHLDLESREALVQAINEFAGAVVLVSHDWHLLELAADRLWLVAGGNGAAVRRRSRRLPPLLLEGAGQADRPQSVCGRRSPGGAAAGGGKAARARPVAAARPPGRGNGRPPVAGTRRRSTAASPHSTDRLRGGGAIVDALKRRAEIIRLIAEAEAEWLATEEAIERESGE